MGKAEVSSFLTHLAVEKHVASSTQNHALSALLFLYRHVLEQQLKWLDDVARAKRPRRLPVVLNHSETRALIALLKGTAWLQAKLLYGSGLRVSESLRLRVKDLDFQRLQITVREGNELPYRWWTRGQGRFTRRFRPGCRIGPWTRLAKRVRLVFQMLGGYSGGIQLGKVDLSRENAR